MESENNKTMIHKKLIFGYKNYSLPTVLTNK